MFKERKIPMRASAQELVLRTLEAPWSFLDVMADLHFAESGAEADGLAMREDWEFVGECIRDAMDNESEWIVTATGPYNDR